MASTHVTASVDFTAHKKLPGDLAMWFFILAELTVFAIFFIAFAVTEQIYPEQFANGKESLHTAAGLVNTLALITSSLFVALSLQTLLKKNHKLTFLCLGAGQVFALVYIGVKLWEYSTLFDLGIDLETNTFYTLYFLITAFHLLHVLLGMVILTYLMVRVIKGGYTESVSGYEAGAAYWHMVDLVWIILFPLIYVI